MRKVLLAMGVLLPLSAAFSQPPARQPVREGPIERLVLDAGTPADAAVWHPSEASVAVDTKHVKQGQSSIRFHVDVNWETGEKNYPIGWPRMNRPWPKADYDWTPWDYLEFSIYVESSRDSLPKVPMGINIYGARYRKIYTRALTELKLGQWTDYRLPVADLPSTNPITGMQVYISESEYHDGDKLDFWISNISLIRYVSPTVIDSKLAEHAIMADSKYLTMEVAMMGVKPGAQANVDWAIASGDKVAASGQTALGRGTTHVYLPLPAKGLAPGEYEVNLKCGGQGPPPFHLRVVASPWQEVSK